MRQTVAQFIGENIGARNWSWWVVSAAQYFAGDRALRPGRAPVLVALVMCFLIGFRVADEAKRREIRAQPRRSRGGLRANPGLV